MGETIIEPLPIVPSCWSCRHKVAGRGTCAAFPDGIPDVIASGAVPHTAPYPRDGGVRYEPDP